MLIYLRICHLKRRLRYETDSLQLIWYELSISRILKEANKYSSDATKHICWNACIACKHWQFKSLCILMQMNVKCSILRLRLTIYSREIVRGVQFHFEKASIFSVHSKWRNLKITQLLAVILDLCLRKIRPMKWHNYRNDIVSEKLRFENVFRPH